MILKYGSYSHAINEGAITIARDSLVNDANVPYAVLERWRISGMLMPATQTIAGVTTAIQELEAAYVKHGQDLTLYQDDGTTATAHQILTANTIGGTRVVRPPGFPQEGEYTTFRSYEIEIEAEIPLSGGPSILLFEEFLAFSGGGPRDIFIELLNGPPQKQRVNNQTVFRATQSGRAVGYARYPAFPTPIWPQHWDEPAKQRNYGKPKISGAGASQSASEFPIDWTYQFHSAFATSGRPNIATYA